MKTLLQKISKEALSLNPDFFTDEEKLTRWIGRTSATDEAIANAEKKLGIKLPDDVIELYKASNGTSVILNQCFGAFETIDKIGWLKDTVPYVIDDYSGMGEAYRNDLENSIVIAGIDYVHMVLIIQPYSDYKEWRYWEFAHYIPGETPFRGIEKYLERLIDFIIDQNKNKAETENK
jgi:SMI1 / KNR4 family (SUKH-1)